MSSANPPTDVSGLFEQASELRGHELRAFLGSLTPETARTVSELLYADAEAEVAPIWHKSAAAAIGEDERDLPFEAVGPYRILERIGAGGMGVVYLAEGDYDGVRKRVAIKAMPYSFDDAMVRRFRQERLILASLDHPNIARMLDAGTTPEGIPYLVMEYVDGIPLTRYAAEQGLSAEARLGLFRSICGAVAYAHRNLIVHRDLKPANILVTREGIPKLLDFGIARLLAEAGPDLTGAAVMTRAYASPEQIAGQAITTASDIYSLGVILRELVAGRKHGGDIGNVIAMALREEPERRYASAADFAEDVRRVMERYPVLARPDTAGYRVRKFISRRPVEVSVVAALTIAALVAGGIALEQYRAANRRFNEVRAIANSFLFEVYDSSATCPPPRRPAWWWRKEHSSTWMPSRATGLPTRRCAGNWRRRISGWEISSAGLPNPIWATTRGRWRTTGRPKRCWKATKAPGPRSAKSTCARVGCNCARLNAARRSGRTTVPSLCSVPAPWRGSMPRSNRPWRTSRSISRPSPQG